MPFPTSGLSSLEPSVVKWNGIRYITSFLTSLVLSVLYEMRKEVHTISSLISPSHRRGWSSSIPSPRILVSLISSSFLSEPEATGWKEIRILLSDPKEMSKWYENRILIFFPLPARFSRRIYYYRNYHCGRLFPFQSSHLISWFVRKESSHHILSLFLRVARKTRFPDVKGSEARVTRRL